ncbi:carboxylesterase/lipase family protein [Stackebrandtia nassauensis]|uniref:Carboxylic ester hydrolase n=1 Tax=Stackebrandtia nassauensis (strain DSM 44728 / CIP 108903 / NRRL B-16338 / NBRC 102104 / LLR-40K-21) TaxID=446470 RepID=D3PUM9_STANL|nr:carboxylesterase family protein [Stackebrandtia nassauensis]ADD43042.1 Carboxylesterase [Stackebrandtia nassauensis DSM 44728]
MSHKRPAAVIAALLLALGLVACAEPAASAPSTRVETADGPVRGDDRGGYRTFEGIPFAAAPVGDLRWQPPQPVKPWKDVRKATEPESLCVQAPDDPVPGKQSEDCLYLNVTTPDTATPDKPKPVMVWLYGGGFYQGNAAEYDARRLATEGDVVVVTPNYRLGVFGYFDHPELDDGGAYGLADQQAALRWVRDNAAAFGGDADNVTLFGESAGAMSVCAQLTAPDSAKLFHKAIMQSGNCLIEWPSFTEDSRGQSPFESAKDNRALGSETAAEANCDKKKDPIACLREQPADELTDRMRDFTPGYGNSVLPRHPAIALRDGDFNQVPIIIGNTRDEARTSITGAVESPLSKAAYTEALTEDFGERAEAVAREYPPGSDDNGLTYAKVNTDRTWAYSTHRTRQILAETVPTFAFEFADREAPYYPGMVETGYRYGAFHGSEVPYLFDIHGVDMELSRPQAKLGERMIAYWTRFAATGDPNGGNSPQWSHFESGSRHVQSLAPGKDGIAAADFETDHHIEFWTEHLND